LGRAFTGKLGSAGIVMAYSYTQISHYLTCPRRYRYRYVDGWKEKDTRAAMLFGRAFELALGAYFRREDPGEAFFREWLLCKEQKPIFPKNDSWDRMLEQAIMLLIRFCHDNRVRISEPSTNLQAKFTRTVGTNDFVSYIDGIGTFDDKLCLLEWKTSSARYPEEPPGLLALDPQLVCYSWITGIEEVAQVVFVRKRFVEIQYLRTKITEEQRREFGHLVENTIRRIESADFLPHSGIRFPQNPCSSCPYVGLCLGRQEIVEAGLVRRPGAEDFGWIDELNY
jgi:CRISPR/Cas system-associated exonuclease Cas4 (RecB family)